MVSKNNSINNKVLNNKEFNNIITSSNALLKLFCTLTVTVIICILIGQYAFKNGMLTCDNYILNTYLYIILSILLTSDFRKLSDSGLEICSGDNVMR